MAFVARSVLSVPQSAEWSEVAKLAVSTLYLHKVQTYRGYAILVFDPRHATRLSELTAEERQALWNRRFGAGVKTVESH
jgi:hypothetical protein